jgi:GxxExxY protein
MNKFESLPPEVQARYNSITEKIIAAGYNVLNALGPGFLEKVYENAMVIELREMGLTVEQQKVLKVYYKGHEVGFYVADLFVEELIPVELKAVRAIEDAFETQLLNELTASRTLLGLILNFGNPRLGIRRLLNSNL